MLKVTLAPPSATPPPSWPAQAVPLVDPDAFLADLPLSGLSSSRCRRILLQVGDGISTFLGYSPLWHGVSQDFLGQLGSYLWLWQRPVTSWPLAPVVGSTYQPGSLDPGIYNVDYTGSWVYKPSTWQAFSYDALIARPELQPFAQVRPAWQVDYFGGWWTDTLAAMTAGEAATAGATSLTIALQGAGYPPGLDAGSRVIIGSSAYSVTAPAVASGATIAATISPALGADLAAGAALSVYPAGIPMLPGAFRDALERLVQQKVAGDRAPSAIAAMGKDGASVRYKGRGEQATPEQLMTDLIGSYRRVIA